MIVFNFFEVFFFKVVNEKFYFFYKVEVNYEV